MSKVEIPAELLADLKRKAQKATPGPWAFWILEGPLLGGNYQVRSHADPDEDFVCRHVESAANAKYIAAASPDAVLALVERIEKQEKEADWLAKNCQGVDNCPYLALGWENDRPDWCQCTDTVEDGFDCYEDPIDCWREAAREAVEGQDG